MKRAADRDPDHHMGRLRGHYSPSNKAVERYRSANDGMMITMFFPAISGRAAIFNAAATAAPEEMPTGMPSSRATCRAPPPRSRAPSGSDRQPRLRPTQRRSRLSRCLGCRVSGWPRTPASRKSHGHRVGPITPHSSTRSRQAGSESASRRRSISRRAVSPKRAKRRSHKSCSIASQAGSIQPAFAASSTRTATAGTLANFRLLAKASRCASRTTNRGGRHGALPTR